MAALAFDASTSSLPPEPYRADESGEYPTGAYAEITVADLLQLYARPGRSGVLRIDRGPEAGAIYLDGTMVTDAETPNATGVAAFVEIMTWTNGRLRFLPDAPIEGLIMQPLVELLASISRVVAVPHEERGGEAELEGEIERRIELDWLASTKGSASYP